MFTGIIEEVGRVQSISPTGMIVQASEVLSGVKQGDSIAVNGVCLTVTSFTAERFSMDIVPETWRRTSLGELRPGGLVNLERPLSPTSRMGGHFVQGHVDGTARIVSMVPEGEAINVRFEAPSSLARYIVEKGFIAIDGISLTVVESGPEHFSVTIIPFTQSHTNFQALRPGSRVNLEVDILAKYVERLVDARREAPAALEGRA